MAESKGPTGAGMQYTGKGPVQGIVLLGSDGRPFDVVVDNTGKHRLAVDSSLTLEGNITVDLSSNTDSVAIGNGTGSDLLFVESDGSISTRMLDGSGNALSSDSRGSTRALAVELVDASGNQITTFGGGTEYDEGDSAASVTGSVIMVRDSLDQMTPWKTGSGDIYPGVEITNTTIDVSGTIAIDQTTDGTTNGVSITNPTIEKTVGAAAGTLVLAVGGTDGTNARMLKTDTDGNAQVDVLTMPTVTVQDGGGAITVDGAVTVSQGTATNLKTQAECYQGGAAVATGNALFVQPGTAASFLTTDAATTAINNKMVSGTDIGDVTINNANGINAVNIQDGGNTITVDGTVVVTQATAANLNCTEASASAIKTAVETIDNIVSGSGANISQINGVTPLMGSGATGTGSLRVTAATDSPEVTSLAVMDDWDESDRCKVSLPALSISRNIDIDESGDNQVNTTCKLYGWYIHNKNAAILYLKLYNVSGAPTVGTTTPVMTIPIPPGAAANVSFPNGITFGTGLGVGATTGVADNDTGAPGANDLVGNFFYI